MRTGAEEALVLCDKQKYKREFCLVIGEQWWVGPRSADCRPAGIDAFLASDDDTGGYQICRIKNWQVLGGKVLNCWRWHK